MNFKRVLSKSGLAKTEIAALYGVSRQTIHAWVRVGPPRAGSYTDRMARAITAAVLALIKDKTLPLPERTDATKASRAKQIAALAAKLQRLSPAK